LKWSDFSRRGLQKSGGLIIKSAIFGHNNPFSEWKGKCRGDLLSEARFYETPDTIQIGYATILKISCGS
jgi:hypothetical protein